MVEESIMKELTFIKKIINWFQSLSKTQLAVDSAMIALALAGIIGSITLAETLNASNSTMDTEMTEQSENLYPQISFQEEFGVMKETEMTEAVELTEVTELTEATEVTEVVEEVRDIAVRITTTSIERDLKIKIIDKDWDLVRGFPFAVTVTFQGESKDYSDHDKDGIIHIQDIEGGEYTVTLHELEGTEIKTPVITAQVKGKIEYEKVEIENEIQDETQVNVSVEDTGNNKVVEEKPIVDTLPLIESTITMTTVPVEKVDVSNLPAAVVSAEKKEETLHKTKVEIVTPKPTPDEESTEMEEGNAPSKDDVKEEENTPSQDDAREEENTPSQDEAEKEENTPSQEDTEKEENAPSQEEGESVLEENGGSLEPQGFSVNSTGVTQTTTLASATVRIPEAVTLYVFGNEASISANIQLEIEDESNIIQSFEWKIDNADVAELIVDEANTSAKLVAKSEGKAKVIISFVYISDEKGNTNTKQLECEVTVSKYTDTVTQLMDVDGNLLYADKNAQKTAVPADLGTITEFYTNPKYTGWQSINGHMYYFTSEQVPAVGSHTIGGIHYTFQEDGILMESEESVGIDVSKWQAKIDWEAVANAGIDFAIIRCGYRGSATGVIVEDPTFKANIEGAIAHGIRVGVYFFTQAITEAEAVEEASTAIALVSGYKLQFPIYIDTEEATNGRANRLGRAQRTAIVKAFCETVRNSGYKPGIYASKAWFNDNLDISKLSSYHIWVAQYNTECNYGGRYDMWQYTDKGSIPGIKGKVDMNICYTKY